VRALGLVFAVLIAAACSVPSTAPLRVVRFSGIQPVSAFARSVADGAAAQRLYDAVVSLPPAQNRWCAYGTGAGYRLTFTDTIRRTLDVTVEIAGCYEAVLHGIDRRSTSDAFWRVFANTLGLELWASSQLFQPPLSVSGLGTGSRAPALRDRFAPRRR
jgi:hypothetical protein